MPTFVVIAALMTLAATTALVWALRRGASRVLLALAFAVPVLVAALYVLVGTPAALDPATRQAPESLADAVVQLERDLERDPRQPEGWLLLGRAYAGMQQPERALAAFERAAKLLPDEDGVQVEYAQARANADPSRRFDDIAVATLRGVVARNPAHQHARWYLGIAQRQAGDHAGAAETWAPLLPLLDGNTGATLRVQIDAARAAAGLPPLPAAETAAPGTAAGMHAINVRVALDPAFAARTRLRGDASVFVIARVPGGPPMPVAVQKHGLQALPLDVVLGDGDSPMPTQRLSALDEVEVFARLSASGDANAQDGNIDSPPVRVRLPADGPVELVIGKAD
ncbi:tetratricopeptide repeat protein [Luteimonas sp. BDR2-5]|uniref:tetratricopeptide repeat protein n=1 Tax=Proluteimonas luteida TaxID=2878685 RepID=UPI001E4FD3E7|nr:tetratricopeptide repeat protein [Luteimonas sp. BDR2-5]MCD9028516.1 tetratricopeptide repeat protein [Luteimonas sp. BDR2-5]